MFSSGLRTEWNRNGSPAAIASSYGPKEARRWATKSASQVRAPSGVTGSQNVAGSPGWSGKASVTSRITARVSASGPGTGSGGTVTPRGSGWRFSASKFQRPPAGASPSIRIPVRRRCQR